MPDNIRVTKRIKLACHMARDQLQKTGTPSFVIEDMTDSQVIAYIVTEWMRQNFDIETIDRYINM